MARQKRSTTGRSAKKNLSPTRKPEHLSLDDWQVELRRQFAIEQDFKVHNIGDEPIFSEFEVTNPKSGRTYRVAIRGSALGENFCSCPDFAVNTLGTCKHIEFVLERLARRSGAKSALAQGHRPAYAEVFLQYGAQRQVIFRPGTESPAALGRLAGNYFNDGRLQDEAYATFPTFLRKAQAAGCEVRCYDDALAFIGQVRDKAMLRERIDAAFPRGVRSAAWRDLLRVSLYPYQREGALFAAQAGRCLIADEMGLGKTVQAIAAAEILARHAGIERVLIVCPTSLKHQWHSEIEKFAGRDAVVVEGLSPRRRGLYQMPSFFKIVNYNVIGHDADAIAAWKPDLIILDEAQRIKNWKTRTAQSVKQLESPFAIVLTGTPLENRLEELHSIVEFVDRFRLGPMFRFLDAHQQIDETGRPVGYRNLTHIAQTLEPILVRRTKDKVLTELPPRLEKRFFVPMSERQSQVHRENQEYVAQLVNKWRRFGFLSETDQLRLQMALQNMRMACDSTFLLDKTTDDGVKADEVATLLDEMLEEPDVKVVIFSQWLRMHELIVRRLEARGLGHVLFYGGVPSRERKDLVQRFKEDAQCRLFLSTDAGGVGLNLQHARAVINVDQPWNPAVLEQRIGRVHRLGQKQPVRVIHFIAENTIEHGMLDVLAFKKSVFAGVLDGGQNEVFMGGTRLTKFMESVEKVTGAIHTLQPSDDGEVERPAGDDEPEVADVVPAVSPKTNGETGHVDSLGELLSAGASLLTQLSTALASPNDARAATETLLQSAARFVHRDEPTGQSYLRLPMPSPEVVEQALALARTLLGGK